MNLAESYPILLLILSLAAALLVTVMAWRYRARRSVKTFFAAMLALDWWLLCSTLETNASYLATHVFWMNMSYFGIILLPVLWLIFTLHYTDRGEWWRRRGLPLLFIIPLITTVLIWTNGQHHLMWGDVQLDTSVYPPLKIITFHTWFWVHAFYSYALLVIGFVQLVGLYVRTSGLYRRQVRIMLAATFVPWVANILYVFGVVPNFAIDPTPIAFVFTGAAFLWGFSRVKLLSIMPVAYEAIFKSISDGVIVIDMQNRIRQLNPAAARILPAGEAELTGKKLCQVIPARAYVAETIADSGRTETVISLGTARQPRIYKVSVATVSDGQNVSGRLVLLHDDTERRKAENESREKALLKTELNERKKIERLQHDENYVLTLMNQGAELNEILDAVVRMVEANDPNIAGSVMLYDESRDVLLPAAAPTLPASFMTQLKNGVPVGPEAGACGAAAFRKERVIVPDIRRSPLFASKKTSVRKAAWKKLVACWSEPIIGSDGQILGTIANFQDKVGEPNADNLKVLEWSARIAAIAIEKRRSEQALADEAVRRRILIEQSSDGIVVLHKSGKVYEVNQRFADMLGYSLEEARQLSVWDWEFLYPPEQVTEMINTVDESGDHFETQHRRKDGSIYDVEISTNGADFAGQKLIFCVCRDITERKQAEEALRKSDEFGTSLLKNAPNPILVINPDTSIKYLNPAFEKLTGFTAARFIGQKSPHPWWPEEEKDKITAGQKRLTSGKNGGSAEFVFKKKNGERFWVAVKVARIMNEGKLRYLLVNWVDITESKRAEEELRESEERFRLLADYSTDVISRFQILPEVKTDYISPSSTRITGYEPEEFYADPQLGLRIIHPDDRDFFMKEVFPNREKDPKPHLLRLVRKDGGVIWVEQSTTTIFNEKGKPAVVHLVAREVTERKNAEDALRESEEKFSKAFRSSPNSMCVSTLEDGVFLEVNDSFTRDTGWTREEAVGRSSRELGLWVEPEERARIVRKIRRDGRVVNEEYRCRTKSGALLTQLFSAEPISFAGEDCILAVTADITERKRMEEMMRESEEKYRMIFESANDIIILLDKKGKIIDINQQIETIGGYNRDDLLGKNFRTLTRMMPKKSIAVIAKNFMLRLLGIKVPTYEVQMYRASGELLDVEINAVVVKENDKPIGTLATLRDVTERYKSESALRYQRELIDQIIATIPNAVLVTNKDKEVLLANNTFYQTFGLSKEDIENKPITGVLRVKEFSDALTAIIKSKQKSLSFEFRYRLQNALRIFAAGIVKMENNRYLVFMNDVTEEREKQERLYLTDRLASVGEMASGVAHELNNPLTSIIGLSGLLIREEMPAEQREDLVAIHAEAERCAAIVKNLLTFARKHAPKRERIQVTKILEDVLKLRAYEQRGQNIAIKTDLAPNLPEVEADYFQMQQVFLNIILNAETAMVDANGRGTLKITSRKVDGHVDISFEDDGPGITKENMGLIFNPFFTTKEVGKGTGLGLSISYGIVASHGGRIYAKGPSEKGATFVVELPVLNN